MTQRKPPGVSFESWIDRQIREATERGEFDGLPGTGKPIADLDQPYDEMWWVRRKLRRENLSYLPPTLALRKQVEEALAAVDRATAEPEVRHIVAGINAKIREANRKPTAGPPTDLSPFDVEQVVADWHGRAADSPPSPATTEVPAGRERPPSDRIGSGGSAVVAPRRSPDPQATDAPEPSPASDGTAPDGTGGPARRRRRLWRRRR